VKGKRAIWKGVRAEKKAGCESLKCGLIRGGKKSSPTEEDAAKKIKIFGEKRREVIRAKGCPEGKPELGKFSSRAHP